MTQAYDTILHNYVMYIFLISNIYYLAWFLVQFEKTRTREFFKDLKQHPCIGQNNFWSQRPKYGKEKFI